MTSPRPRRAAPALPARTVVRLGAACGAVTAVGAVAAAPAAAAAARSEVAFTIRDPRITESSGLAASKRHPGVVYTHNDSGGRAEIFALGPDGRTRAVLTLAGAQARDWEAMALGRDERGRPAIYVGDIGDNMGGAWPYITVYRIPEPAELRSQTLRATAFRLKYEDGPRNAETMMINPRTNRLYVASKLFSGKIYEAPARLRTSGFNTLRRVGDAPGIATDGAFSPDGRLCVIRTYFGARAYTVGSDGRPGKSLGPISLPGQKQGESLTFTADGRSLLAGSEGGDQPVYRVPLPENMLPASPSPARTGGGGSGAEDGRRDSTGASVGLVAALAVAGALGYAIVRKRS
ncbi:hypothetical protein [Actinomadura keratinilytica]|jgi:hypothetical protein|uniref:WD40 repeat domain-containing protein n=1 Tax=Actinomadura keratinilytica TaxID=547461 RepID=A0ABP7Z1K1_9ACTN